MTDSDFVVLFEKLCSIPGVSGQEQNVAKAIKAELISRGAQVSTDRLGNVSAVIKGQGKAPSLMFIAHMDEVGAIVSEVCDNGLLNFRTVGCVAAATLAATKVLVDGVPGAISAPPAHMDKGEAPRLYIDVGAESKEEVYEMGIDVGSMVSFDTAFTTMGKNRVCGHALDDRVGCTMLIKLLEDIDFVPDGDVILGFSIREETNMTGAGMLVDMHKPDWAVPIDTVPMRMSSGGRPLIDIGKGPVFQLAEGVMSAYVGNFVHVGVKKALIKAARDANMPYQLCAEVGDWTTDGDTITRANGGTPSGYLSIPRRSAHSAAEVMDLRDPLRGVEIMKALIKNMSEIELDIV